MTKITLNDVSSFQNDSSAVATVNNNSDTIVTAFDNTLSRDGTSPNEMLDLLDMNSNRIINLPAPLSLSEPLRLQDAETLNGAGTIEIGTLPNGGTTGQALVKISNADQDAGWADTHYIPSGGTAGQVLTKNSATNYDASWVTTSVSTLPNTVLVLSTRASLASTTVSGAVNLIYFMGYATAGDCTPFYYKRLSSAPLTTYGAMQSLDGTWWQYLPGPEGVDVEAFGAKGDWNGVDASATNNAAAVQEAINFAALPNGRGEDRGGGVGNDVIFGAKSYMVSSQLTVYDGVRLLGKSPTVSVIVMPLTFPTTDHFIILGTPGSVNSIALSQSRVSAGNFTLNGATVVSGVAILPGGRNPVTVYSSGNDSGITFTVHGTDLDGTVIAETIAGSNAGAATTTLLFRTVTSVSCSAATAGNITIGQATYASFSARIERLQLFSQNVNAGFNICMVYTTNAQHWGGLKDVKIFGGNRVCAWFDIGVGGASYFVFEDVETFNVGGAGGANQNMQIYLNYSGLLSPLRNIVCGAPGTGGAGHTGLWINGGFVHLENFHAEGLDIGCACRWNSVNTGALYVDTANGGNSMSNLFQCQVGVVPASTIVLSNTFPNGATNTLLQTSGAAVTGNVIAPTLY